jgi:UDP-glucose 4-epimerase
MHTILVTGGAGFIGSHVAEKLDTARARVVVFDNLSTGLKTAIPKHTIFVKGDVRSNTAVDAVIKKYKPDVVCHIAGQASNINSFTDPYSDVDVNYIGTINVVTACVRNRVPRLVYASSMLAANPTSYYGISKYAAERFVLATALRPDLGCRLRVTSLRMFNVYGSGQSITNPYQGVLAIFIGNVLRGEPIRIFGSGRQTRDFIYIDDVCEAWKRVIHNPKSYGKVLDLGSGKPISINRLATAVIAACGKNPRTYPIIHAPPRPGDLPVVRANRKTPTIAFSEGLQQTVEWAKHNS